MQPARNLREIIPAFFTGPSGERLTPEQIKRRQEVAQSLIARATDTRPDAGGWASVLTKGLLGYQSGRDQRMADEATRANAEANQALMNDVLQSIGGGAAYPAPVAMGASPTSGVATGTATAIPSAPEIRQGLIDRGLPEHVADAFIVNFQDESGLNPGINERNPIVPGSRGGFGLYQLTGPRRRQYEAFAAERGLPLDSVDAQLDFLMLEGSTTEKEAFDKILSSPDTATAAQTIVNSFLRPAPEHRRSRASRYARLANTPAQQAIQDIAPIEQGDENPMVNMPATPEGTQYVDPLVAPYDGRGSRVFDVTNMPEISTAPNMQFDQENFDQRFGSPSSVPTPEPAPAPAPQPAIDESLLAQHDAMWGGALSPTGASPVAQALTGYFPESPSASSAPVASQAGGINPAVIQALSDPYASPETRQVASLLLGQHLQQQAAMQAQQQEQQELAQRQQVALSMGIDPNAAMDAEAWKAAVARANRDRSTVTVGNTVYDANTGQPVIQVAQERFTTITGPQAQQLGLDPNKAYNVAPDGKVTPIAESGVTVNVGGGEKFDEKLAELDAKAIGDVDTAGRQAIRNLGRINQLEELLKASPSGIGAAIRQKAGEWGIKTDGLDTLQAAQAVINSLVPEQRPAGSGPMSDADLELFKQSLPRTINQPGGNELIINTMRGIAQYDAQGAEIIQLLRARQISREDAFRLLNERKNPLDEFKAAQAGQVAPTGPDGWRDMGNGVRIRPKGAN